MPGSEVEHRDQVLGIAIAASLALGGRENAKQTFHECVGGAGVPVGEDAVEVTADHAGAVGHFPEQ